MLERGLRASLQGASTRAAANYGYSGLDRMLALAGLEACALVCVGGPFLFKDLALIRRSFRREQRRRHDIVALWRAVEMSCFLEGAMSRPG